MATKYLADKSALARMPNASVCERLEPLILAGEIFTCSIVDLEVFYSARTHADLVEIRTARERAYPLVPMEQTDFDRAIDVMEALSRRGHHRAVSIPDLLIAAVAERSGLTVLHYDGDFDLIAAHTKQRTEWIVRRGSVS